MTAPNKGSWLRRIDQTGVPLLVARLGLGVLFIVLGAKKVADPVAFLKQIHLYGMLPESPGVFLNATAIVMPWFEIVAGVALVLGVLLRGSGLLMAALLALFTPAIFIRALGIMSSEGTPFFQISFDCGCGAGEVVIWQKLLENLGLFLLALLVIASRSRRFCLQLWLEGRRARPG